MIGATNPSSPADLAQLSAPSAIPFYERRIFLGKAAVGRDGGDSRRIQVRREGWHQFRPARQVPLE
jgi:hypothetical protein